MTDSDRDVLNTSLLLSYCHDVAAGLHYLSSRKILHRDIAARNVRTLFLRASQPYMYVVVMRILVVARFYTRKTCAIPPMQVLLDAASTCKVSDFGMSSAVGGEDSDCKWYSRTAPCPWMDIA